MSINLLSLKAIIALVSDLKECYSEEKIEGIDTYLARLEAIPIADHLAISNITDEWEILCRDNIDAISARAKSKWLRIETGFPIDFVTIFSIASKDEEDIIWSHLETITATLIPEQKHLLNKAIAPKKKQMPPLDPALLMNAFKGVMSGEQPSFDPKKFEQIPELASIPKMIEKLEKNIETANKPEELIGTILTSPEFMEMVQNFQKYIQDGSLDINQLLSVFVPGPVPSK